MLMSDEAMPKEDMEDRPHIYHDTNGLHLTYVASGQNWKGSSVQIAHNSLLKTNKKKEVYRNNKISKTL